MRTEPQPSDREVLAGLVERVTYQNAENGFCVIRVKARGHRDLITVVGHTAMISAGEWITASGDWTNDRTHGQQFKARFLKTSAPTSIEGIEKYLASGMIRGIGPVYAKNFRGEGFRRHRGGAGPLAGSGRHRTGAGKSHRYRLGRAKDRPRDHGVSAQSWGRVGASGADPQRGFSHEQRLAIFRRDGGVCQLRLRCKGHGGRLRSLARGSQDAAREGWQGCRLQGQVACPECNLSKGATTVLAGAVA
jgi:hypothetical protein